MKFKNKRNSLFSTAVGTPGVDLAAANMAAEGAKTLKTLRDVGALRQHELNKIKSFEENQKITNTINEQIKEERNLISSGQVDLEEGMKRMKKMRADLNKQLLEDIKGRDLKQQTTLRNQKSLATGLNEDMIWAEKFQISDGVASTQRTLNSFAQEVGVQPNMDKVVELYDQKLLAVKGVDGAIEDGILQNSKTLYTPEELENLRSKVFKSGAISYITNQMTDNPDLLKKEFDNGALKKNFFGVGLEDEEMEMWGKRINNAVIGKRVETQIFIRKGIFDHIKSDNPSLDQLLKYRMGAEEAGADPDDPYEFTESRKVAIDTLINNKQKQIKEAKKGQEDPKVFDSLTVRHAQTWNTRHQRNVGSPGETNFKAKGTLKNTNEALEECIDYLVDVENAYQLGQINDDQLRGLKKDVRSVVEDFLSADDGQRLKPKEKQGFFNKGRKEPSTTADGLKQIDNLLKPIKMTDNQRLILRGKLMTDFMILNNRDEDNGVLPDYNRNQEKLNEVFQRGAKTHGFPALAPNTQTSFYDKETGTKYIWDNGAYLVA